MKYRTLGKTGFEVSEIGFGAWGIGGGWWHAADDAESMRVMRTAFDLGINFIDTAYNYGDGHSETLVGRAAKEASGDILVATKIPPKNYGFPSQPGTPLSEAYPTDWMIECTETSLKRLGLETIDLQQFHVWLDEWADMDEWKEAVVKLKQQGKVRTFGLSLNFPMEPDYGAAGFATGLIEVCQVAYNIFDQIPAAELFPLARQENIGIIVKSPLDEGALTGTITPDTKFPEDSFQGYYFRDDRPKEVWERVKALEFLLAGDSETMAEAALRFCLSPDVVSTVIAGTRKVTHMEANAKASDKGPLPPEYLERLKEHAWVHNYWA